jgi:hypothetical protein
LHPGAADVATGAAAECLISGFPVYVDRRRLPSHVLEAANDEGLVLIPDR